MAFDYQTLKNLSGTAFIANSLTGSDIGSSQVTNAKIANTTLTSTEFGSGSVDVSQSTVTGTLNIGKGGTNLTSLGGAYYALMNNGSSNGFMYAPTGIRRMLVYTGNSTWTRDTYVRYIHIQCVGAGGGAGGHGESGAAGGYSERILEVLQNNINNVSITIGSGGGGTYYNNAGGNGNSSSFGPYVSAGGGHGACRHNNHNGGLSGAGSGGDLNIHQGCGGGHEQRSSGMGGSTYFGGPAPSGHPQGGHFSHNHQGHAAPGTGGTAGYFQGHRGSDGRPGLIVVTEYY